MIGDLLSNGDRDRDRGHGLSNILFKIVRLLLSSFCRVLRILGSLYVPRNDFLDIFKICGCKRMIVKIVLVYQKALSNVFQGKKKVFSNLCHQSPSQSLMFMVARKTCQGTIYFFADLATFLLIPVSLN